MLISLRILEILKKVCSPTEIETVPTLLCRGNLFDRVCFRENRALLNSDAGSYDGFFYKEELGFDPC